MQAQAPSRQEPGSAVEAALLCIPQSPSVSRVRRSASGASVLSPSPRSKPPRLQLVLDIDHTLLHAAHVPGGAEAVPGAERSGPQLPTGRTFTSPHLAWECKSHNEKDVRARTAFISLCVLAHGVRGSISSVAVPNCHSPFSRPGWGARCFWPAFGFAAQRRSRLLWGLSARLHHLRVCWVCHGPPVLTAGTALSDDSMRHRGLGHPPACWIRGCQIKRRKTSC